MANHEIVPTSAFTKGTAERKKSTTSFSLPGFASSGTYSANFVITLFCLDRGHQVRRPAPHISQPPTLSTFTSLTVTDQLGEGTRTRMLWQYSPAWRGLALIANRQGRALLSLGNPNRRHGGVGILSSSTRQAIAANPPPPVQSFSRCSTQVLRIPARSG